MRRHRATKLFKPRKRRARIEKPLKSEATTITGASDSDTEPTTDPAPDWSFMAPEVLLRIFSKLNYNSLRDCATTCRLWLQCANDESLALVLIDILPFIVLTDNATRKGGNLAQVKYKSFTDDGDYTEKVFSMRDKYPSYLKEDYIELREHIKDYMIVYLRATRLPETIDPKVQTILQERLNISLLGQTESGISRKYRETFEPMDPRSLSVPNLHLNDDQQQAAMWMMDKEMGKTTFNIRPMVPLKNTPLAMHIPSEKFQMKRDIPEVTFYASSGMIVADTFSTAAGEVIGLIYATLHKAHKKGLKTLIVVKDMARATRWAEYLLKVPDLYFAINPPPFVPSSDDRRVSVWIYTDDAQITPWTVQLPTSRVIVDGGRYTSEGSFRWHLRIMNETKGEMKAKDFTRLITLKSDSVGVAEEIQSSEYKPVRYFRDWKLEPQLVQHFVWICRGEEFSIKSEKTYPETYGSYDIFKELYSADMLEKGTVTLE